MKIAIIAPSPVPFTIGGAEKLWSGLHQAINAHTPHQCELIKVPSPERNFHEIIASYETFSKLELPQFDLVISGKYPAWMVRHPHHVIYMLHRLRGLYDVYHLMNQPLEIPKDPSIADLCGFMDRHEGGSSECLPEFFGRIRAWMDPLPSDHPLLRFPGPFIRRVVHFLDNIGMSTANIRRYASISHNITRRAGYFPNGTRVEVIHPPSDLHGFRNGRFDYFFTVSRLDRAKRIGLLIEALRQVEDDVQLRIAGTGPDEHLLKSLTGGDPRIVFLGFVNDQQLVEHYADALGVLFTPFDEDYGLVTVEAMMSGKPVITTNDAGGPLEFVRDGWNGFVTPPDAQAIARKLSLLYQRRLDARLMGQRGLATVSGITWERTARRLVQAAAPPTAAPARAARKRIVVAITFPAHPPTHGGKLRAYHLYRNLACHHDVEIVALSPECRTVTRREIALNLVQTEVPQTEIHKAHEYVVQKNIGHYVTDVVFPEMFHLSPDYLRELRRAVRGADLLIACHPYVQPALRSVSSAPIWYEAQDVEVDVKRQQFAGTGLGADLLQRVGEVERACCAQSELVMTCSDLDARRLQELYQVPADKLLTVPNGVDLREVTYQPPSERRRRKTADGLDGCFMASFIGSWHQPNIDAVHFLLSIAPSFPAVSFIIVGGAGNPFKDQPQPENVSILGMVDNETRDAVLARSDVALNPILTGSGTNLKMLEYLAAGIPVVTTPFGARGLGLEPGEHCLFAHLESFGDAILRIRAENDGLLDARAVRARQHVEMFYDWRVISNLMLRRLDARSRQS